MITVCASALLSGVVAIHNKSPDYNANNEIIYTYHKSVYVVPSVSNINLDQGRIQIKKGIDMQKFVDTISSDKINIKKKGEHNGK